MSDGLLVAICLLGLMDKMFRGISIVDLHLKATESVYDLVPA